MSFNFAPKGWAMCNGQLLPINQNQALFSLLGTTFGGNGQTNFALPDFRGRIPIHVGSGHTNGEKGGAQAHTISNSELPVHQHAISVSDSPATVSIPTSSHYFANSAPSTVYTSGTNNLVAMHPQTISNVGGNQPHENMQPYLTLTFCIALQGIFPSPN